MLNPLRLFLYGLVFQKGEGDEITFVKTSCFEVFRQLHLAFDLVFLSSPDFQLDDELFAAETYHQVHSSAVSRLWLHIVEACAIDNRFEEAEEKQAPLTLQKLVVRIAVLVPDERLETLYDVRHVELAVQNILALCHADFPCVFLLVVNGEILLEALLKYQVMNSRLAVNIFDVGKHIRDFNQGVYHRICVRLTIHRD